MSETPNTVHGRLLEAVHISGYSFERACSELEWLLDEDRWKQIGSGFSDINAFLSTIDLSEFRIAIDQRKKLAKRLKDIEASQRATAKMLGVDETTVRRDLGHKSAANAAGEVREERENSGLQGSAAAIAAPQQFEWFQSETDPATLAKKDAARKHRAEQQAQRDDDLSRAPTVWPEGKYPVLYADPPWRYEHPPIGASNRSIENHYPTMSLDEICALPVGDIVADNAVLFLWATAPKLSECFQVIPAWGFTYRTCMVWVKDKIGMGYHARNKHEILLISKRGELAAPEPGNRPASVVESPRNKHSAKPEVFYEIIETMYPNMPRVELFARAGRDGWFSWGNQAP